MLAYAHKNVIHHSRLIWQRVKSTIKKKTKGKHEKKQNKKAKKAKISFKFKAVFK